MFSLCCSGWLQVAGRRAERQTGMQPDSRTGRQPQPDGWSDTQTATTVSWIELWDFCTWGLVS